MLNRGVRPSINGNFGIARHSPFHVPSKMQIEAENLLATRLSRACCVWLKPPKKLVNSG